MKIFLMIVLTIGLWSLDIDDIQNLRRHGAKVAFTNTTRLQSIPNGISVKEFKRATILDFNGINLSNNLPDLREMKNLRILNLSGVNIELEELKKIKGLDLSVINLNDNPQLFNKGEQAIAFLSDFDLEELYLANTNGNDSSYSAIGTSFSNLRILDLSNNNIKNLKKIYLQKLSNLERLNLKDNNLRYFDTAHLPKRTLQKLNLANTNFSKFNYTGDFPSLVSLDLSGNDSVRMDKKYQGAMVLQKLKHIKPRDLISKKNNSFSSLTQSNSNRKWITPSKEVCENNGGKMSSNGGSLSKPVCFIARSTSKLKKICSEMGGKVPTIHELEEMVENCGGMVYRETSNDDISYITEKNEANSEYQYCYKKKGFERTAYISSTPFKEKTIYSGYRVWVLAPSNGYTYSQGNFGFIMCD